MWANLKHIYKEILESIRPKERKILVAVTFMLITSGFVISIVRNEIEVSNNEKARQTVEQAQAWAASEKSETVHSSKLDIQFSDVVYTEGIASKMEKAVNNMAKKVTTSADELYISIEPEIIPSEAFITLDGTEEEVVTGIENSTKAESSILQKVGQLYCRDTYIGQYMSESGQFQSIIAQYTGNKIYVYPRAVFENQLDIPFNEESEGDQMSEETYISEIEYCLEGLYGQEWETNSTSVKEKILKYFTVDCGDDLIEKMLPDSATQVDSATVGFIDIGKSDMKIDRVDIVYAQIELSISGKKAYIDLELKLNVDNRIFDFDML